MLEQALKLHEQYISRGLKTQVRFVVEQIGTLGPDEQISEIINISANLSIEVTDIYVENIQNMSVLDGLEEGYNGAQRDILLWFANEWDKDNPKYKWNTNPLVWVIQFKKVCENG